MKLSQSINFIFILFFGVACINSPTKKEKSDSLKSHDLMEFSTHSDLIGEEVPEGSIENSIGQESSSLREENSIAPVASFFIREKKESSFKLALTLDASKSSNDNKIVKYMWYFDGEEVAETDKSVFNYNLPIKEYVRIKLVVADSQGNQDTYSEIITSNIIDSRKGPRLEVLPHGGVINKKEDKILIKVHDRDGINFDTVDLSLNNRPISKEMITIDLDNNEIILLPNTEGLFDQDFNELSFSIKDTLGNISSIETSYELSDRLKRKRETRNFKTPLGIAGSESTCVIVDGGKVYCFGNARMGKLGYGNRESSTDKNPSEMGAVNLSGPAQKVSVYRRNACALLESGDITCWGEHANGMLGLGNKVSEHIGDDDVPSDYPNLNFNGVKFKDLKVGSNHVCAQSIDDDLYCWGNASRMNLLGRGEDIIIGDNEDAGDFGPVPLGEKISSFDVGFIHTCVVTKASKVKCFGNANSLRLGFSTSSYETKVEDMPYLELPEKIKYVSAGVAHSCALSITNKAYCWGRNLYGALGLGKSEQNIPFVFAKDAQALPLDHLYKIVATGFITCALFDDGRSKCWGLNNTAQLGLQSLENMGDDEELSEIPFMNIGGAVEDISSGTNHTCAQFDNGKLKCWGYNDAGSLGNPELLDNMVYGQSELVSKMPFIKMQGSIVSTGVGASSLAYFDLPEAIVHVGEEVVVKGQTSASIMKYEWHFDDDHIIETDSAYTSYRYTMSGTYKVKLKVKDEHGVVIDMFTRSLTVY